MSDKGQIIDYERKQPKPNRAWQMMTDLAKMILIVVGGPVLVLALIYILFPPATSRVSESSNRSRCTSHLRSIGKAIEQYQSDNQGKLPDSIGALAVNSNLVMEEFTCPSSNAERGEPVSTGEQANKILTDPKFASYIYVGDRVDLKSVSDPPIVLFYEPPTNHDRDGVHILFLDQRVKFIRYDRNRAKVDQMILDAETGVRPVRLQR